MLYDVIHVSHVGDKGMCAFLTISKELKILAQAFEQTQKIM